MKVHSAEQEALAATKSKFQIAADKRKLGRKNECKCWVWKSEVNCLGPNNLIEIPDAYQISYDFFLE